MNWHDLSVVLAVAREGTFTGAAQVLKVAHTTVGRRIGDIEENLAAKLFIRTRTSCIPTEECREILKSIERMEAEALSIGDHFQDYEQKPRGLVKLTTMSWVIKDILVPALPTFPEKYSEIELQFTADARERSIANKETDMLLRFDTTAGDKEAVLDLARFSYSVYAPRVDNPDELKRVTYWEDFNNYQPENWLTRMQGEGNRICLRANDASFVIEAIRVGIGKGIIPDFLGASEPEIIRLSGREPEFVRTLQLRFQPDMRKLTRINAVVTWLEQVFRDLPDTVRSS